MTVMDNLHRKGFVDREREGRARRHWPTRSRAEHAAELMGEALSAVMLAALALSARLHLVSSDLADAGRGVGQSGVGCHHDAQACRSATPQASADPRRGCQPRS